MDFAKGILIPIGGNEDKGHHESESESYTMDFIEEGILYHVVKECGGEDSLIVIIPAASSIPVEVGENYITAFEKLGCTNLKVLDIRSLEDADNKESLDYISRANGVMFSGGDQSKIAKKIGGTKFHKIMKERYQNEEHFVIAGTSAGAMMMSHEMIAGGSSTEAFQKGAVTMRKGLGLTPEIIFDTHFIQRGRFGRISEAVAQFPELIGIGLAEDTGLVIKDGNNIKVIGSGMVIVFDGNHLTHNNQHILEEGTPMTMANLRVHVLSNSDRYFIDSRKVEVLPIDAPFE
ncbi:cyanophycinase [bacterium]|nr:cyanophycinase [bacterium]MDB4088032.1 cyanophycinase [Flavobacteriales bacterium]